MKVIFLVNSHIDKKGNFGVRVKKIIDFFERKSGIDFLCVSRGSGKSGSNFINLIFFGIFARFLNWYRLFVYRNLNHRKYERIIFERICLKVLKNKICPNSIVHLFEYSTKIIDYCNINNIPVLIDVPNVTQNFIKEVHSSGKGHFLTYFSDQEKQEQLSLQKADKILSPSDFVTEYLIRLGIRKENISTIPFGANPVKRKIIKNPNPKNMKYLFVGNVDFRKGVPEILQAFSDNSFKNDELILLGKKTREMNKFLKGTKNVHYMGFRNPEKFYLTSDVFLFPSWCEGSAKVIYEAMSYGLPIITTFSSGSIIKNDEGGILVEPGSIKSIKNAMSKLKDTNIYNKISKKNLEKIKQFTWEEYSKKVSLEYSKYLTSRNAN